MTGNRAMLHVMGIIGLLTVVDVAAIALWAALVSTSPLVLVAPHVGYLGAVTFIVALYTRRPVELS